MNFFRSREEGNVIVIVALAMVIMAGFAGLVIDTGYLYNEKAKMQNAVDAACLAGAQELPDDPIQAESIALAYAESNGADLDDNVNVDIPYNGRSIEVTIDRNVPMFFAKLFGYNSTDLSAHAKAQIGIAASVPWIVPFVIAEPPNFDYDKVYVMRMYGAGPYPSGYTYPSDYRSAYPAYPTSSPYPYQFDYMNVKIKAGSNPSSEFNDYLNYLQYGYHETYTLDQKMLYYAPSSGGKPSVDTLAKRIAADPNTDYTKAKIGDPRIMLIPVVSTLLPRTTAENTKVTIIGFVGFWLQSVHKNSYYQTFWFEGRFLENLNIGSGEVTYDSDADFGLRVINLTE